MSSQSRKGLSLLEAIISIWLLFMAIVMATAILHRILHHSKIQEQRTRGAYLAQGKMEELMLLPASALPLEPSRFETPFEGYTWKLRVDPIVEYKGKLVLLRLEVTTPSGEVYELKTQRRGRPDRLWFCSNDNSSRFSRLYQVNEDGSELLSVSTGDPDCNDHYPTLSPDAAMVAFLSDRSKKSQLYLMPCDSSAPPQMVTDHPMGVQEPQWSPNGKQIAYVAYDAGFSQIYIYDLESQESKVVSKASQHEGAPSWSPLGNHLTFVTTRSAGSGTQIAVMKIDGSQRRILTHISGWNTAPSYSPDGKTIAFMSNRDGDSEIYTLGLDTGQVKRLTESSGYDNNPRYSPDGESIVFSSSRRGPKELYVMTSQGQDQRPVISREEPLAEEFFEKEPCWVPALKEKTLNPEGTPTLSEK